MMNVDIRKPDALKKHDESYQEAAWKQYSLAELGQFVHLLAKRATHRSDKSKKKKDLYDARNYLQMMEAHLDALDTE